MNALTHVLQHLAPVAHHLADALANQCVQLAVQLGLSVWVGS